MKPTDLSKHQQEVSNNLANELGVLLDSNFINSVYMLGITQMSTSIMIMESLHNPPTPVKCPDCGFNVIQVVDKWACNCKTYNTPPVKQSSLKQEETKG